MLEERIARSVSAACIVVMVAFAPLYMLLGFAFAVTMLVYGLACAALGIAVGLLLGKKNAALQILAAALPAAALALALPIGIRGADIARYAAMGAGALLGIWTERLALRPAAGGRKVGLLLAPLAVTFAVCAALWLQTRAAGTAPPGLWALMIAIASVWFVAALFMLNRLSLRQAAYSGNQSGIPAGARRSGAVGVAVFAAAVFLLASSAAIVRAIAEAIRWLVARLIEAYLYLMSLLFSGMTGPPQEQQGQGQDMPLPPATEASPVLRAIYDIVLVVFVLAVIALIIYGLYKFLPKLWRKILERIGGLVSSWRQDEGYEDRTESLMSLRQALSDMGAGIRKFARRFRRRPRLGDFPTNAGKARFLFRERLHDLTEARREPPPGATATDIAGAGTALACAYNRARYAEVEPEDREIAKALEELHMK